jgi:hypothetical protein
VTQLVVSFELVFLENPNHTAIFDHCETVERARISATTLSRIV